MPKQTLKCPNGNQNVLMCSLRSQVLAKVSLFDAKLELNFQYGAKHILKCETLDSQNMRLSFEKNEKKEKCTICGSLRQKNDHLWFSMTDFIPGGAEDRWQSEVKGQHRPCCCDFSVFQYHWLSDDVSNSFSCESPLKNSSSSGTCESSRQLKDRRYFCRYFCSYFWRLWVSHEHRCCFSQAERKHSRNSRNRETHWRCSCHQFFIMLQIFLSEINSEFKTVRGKRELHLLE